MALVQAVVGGVGNNPAGSTPPIALGAQADLLHSQVHGKWYHAARLGRLFIGSTAAAGTTIPVSSATAATFTLYNPAGSGVNVELVRYNCGITNATMVTSPILLGLDRN